MVQRARSRGLPAVIYGPGFVIGHSSRATGNPDDFFTRMIIGCIQCGYFPYLPRQRLEWVTVDYVCSALLHIASKKDSLGLSYHLVPPDPTRSVNMEGTCKLLNQAGYPVKQIPYHDWVEETESKMDAEEDAMVKENTAMHTELIKAAIGLKTPNKPTPTANLATSGFTAGAAKPLKPLTPQTTPQIGAQSPIGVGTEQMSV